MLRTYIRIHTGILAAASVMLLVAPLAVLTAFGITNASFAVLAITRVLAGVMVVLAVAVHSVSDLPLPARGRACGRIAVAYGFLGALTITQQVAIWASAAGVLLSIELMVHTAAFAWLARSSSTPAEA